LRTWGTPWELDESTLGIKTKNSPPPSSPPPPKNSKETKKKKKSLLRLLLLGWINFLFSKQLVTIFNLY
jgi:hypothetical protein